MNISSTKKDRRSVKFLGCAALSALVLSGAVAHTHAATFPAKTVTIIVPFAPGGATDLIARIIAPRLASRLGKDVIVENRSGASGLIGSAAVVNAAADGHMLLLTDTSFATAAALTPERPVANGKELTPITMIATAPYVVAVNPQLHVKTLPEFIALARKPAKGDLTYASAGPGSSTHLAGEWFNALIGSRMLQVPYRGGSAAVQGMIAGQVDATFLTIPSVLPYAETGRMKILAVTSEKRSAVLPNVPTTLEAGLPKMQGVNWNGLFASVKTPKNVITQINKEMTYILHLPEIQSQFASMALDPAPGSPENAEAFISKDIQRWTEVIKAGNIKVE